MHDVLLLLKDLMSIPSTTGREEEIGKFLAAILKSMDMDVYTQEVEKGRFNVIGKRGNHGVLIVTHMDTVPADEDTDKLYLQKSGMLRGRGVIDTKGLIAALLSALSRTKDPVTVAFVVDEEETGLGSRVLEVPPSNYTLVLEPTDLKIATIEAGFLEVVVTFYGKSAHGAHPEKGNNALERLYNFLQSVENLSFIKPQHPLFYPPLYLLQEIKGGSVIYRVPDKAILRLNFILQPGISPVEALEELSQYIDEDTEIEVVDMDEAIVIDEDEDVVIRLGEAYKRATGEEPSYTVMRSWTDAANLYMKGLKPVIFGAGSLWKAHTSEESVTLKELAALRDILIEFIEGE